ncbi:MAG: hypothetical protein ABIM50_14940 [Novosphingobium sp.]
MKKRTLAALMVLTILLAACGGSDGGVNSVASVPVPAAQVAPTPAPSQAARTPLPPTPATTSGTYQAIATYTSFDASGTSQQTIVPQQLASEGSITLTVDTVTRTYTLSATAGPYQFPADKMVIPADSDLGYTRSFPLTSGTTPDFFSPATRQARGDLLAHTVATGAAANGALRVITTYATLFNVGYLEGFPRYLSAAQWGQFYQENASGVPGPENYKQTQGVRGLLVFGQRTDPGDIPVSGRARYALNSLTGLGQDDIGTRVLISLNAELDVDFASRKLSAIYDFTDSGDLYKYNEDGKLLTDDDGYGIVAGQVTTAVQASGSTFIAANGSFSLALAGAGSVHTQRLDLTPVPDIAKSLSGSLTGAFFGPQAAEVGGIAFLPLLGEDGSVIMQTAAFAGIRNTP